MMSKDIATPNPSFRVYYGGAPGSVPFTWESAPGTPKHHLDDDDDDSNLPPLTPPPSFYSSSNHSRRRSSAAMRLPNFLFRSLFPKTGAAASSRGLRSSAASSSYSSQYSDRNYNSNCSLSYSSSSTSSSSSSSGRSPDAHGRNAWRSRCFSCSGLHGRRRHDDVLDEEGKGGSAIKKRRSVSLGRWCSFGRVRNAVLSS
ncbi:unnamed protein product [Linum tenue]|uniref:Uncharacterized protein n=1 Tax=Linum tenue TaxID=586396 RepID=A0AAV0J7W2_9ROSI|nr:unnamed protein product [Linum tenue]